MKKRRNIFKRSMLSLFLSLCLMISPLANTSLLVAAASETWYHQDFSAVTDAKTVAISDNAQDSLTISSDGAHGSYLKFDTGTANDRGAYINFTGLNVASRNTYIVEFDAAITPGNQKTSYLTVKGTDFAYASDNINWGPASGYLLNMSVAGNGTEYTLNGTEKVTIPRGEWCHYKLYVDKTKKLVSTTIIGTTAGVIADKVITAYNGTGDVSGIYMLAGRYYPVQALDNIVVRSVNDSDQFAQGDSGTVSTSNYIIAEATGNSTAVDSSKLVKSDKITGYQVTTSKNGALVKQTVVTAAPTSVDTTGADMLEIAPIFFYDIGVAGEKGSGGYSMKDIPAGTYNITVWNTKNQRCDVYVGNQMLVNNMSQYGTNPNNILVKDIVINENAAKISTTDYSSGQSANSVYIRVQIVKSPSIVNRAQKVYVLGDSLVAMYYNGCNASNNLQTGWGQVLKDYLVDTVDVVDLGNSGVTAVGLYGSAFSQIKGSAKKGDILLLESGYNDRSYSTVTEMKTVVTNMINEAEALGVDVILVSPNASAHDYKASVAWTSHMADVARAEGVKYIDLSKLSYDFMYGLYGGDTTVVKAVYNVSDTLHSTYKGANKWASLVAGSLYEQGYAYIVDTDYVFTFTDTIGNTIKCYATDDVAAGYAKVTYEMNGHGPANSYQNVKKGALLERPSDPVASEYVFGGWYKDPGCTTIWNFGTDRVSEDTTLYAKWIESSLIMWYSEDFSAVNAASDVATSPLAQEQLVISTDGTHGKYLAYDFSSTSANSRGAYMDFTDLDVSGQSSYVVEFDAAITPGDNQITELVVKGTDFTYMGGVNNGAGNGYLLKLANTAGGSNTYFINSGDAVTIPVGEWCHYKLYVDKELRLVSTTITGSSTGVIANKVITPYDGAGNVNGLYVRVGRYNPVLAVDNIQVRGVGEADTFGEIPEETLAGAEFATGLGTIIHQPEEGQAIHMPITVKGKGSMGNDLTNTVTVKWSVVGLENEDGYISLTKVEGSGSGTEGEVPDGTTAYFNVRNGVSNSFGYVQAEVTDGKEHYTIATPFAVIGATSANNNQLAPVVGYPINMNDYADSLVGYVGTSTGVNTKEIILNNWSIYGSNDARTMELVKDADGTKSIKFASNGGGGSTVAVYQWEDQKSQYIVDFTAKFSADMSFGVYSDTPNNSTNDPEWTATVNSNSLMFGTQSISGLSTNEWYRFVVSADPSIQKASIAVYNKSGALIGEIVDVDMTNDATVQQYFCFYGTWPMYLSSFKAYKPTISNMEIRSTSDTVKVPENGEAAATVDLSAVLASVEGIEMTSAVEWSLADNYANVEIVPTGVQSARLTIREGASGTITVVAAMDGKVVEKEIRLTISSEVAFKESVSFITIPFAGEAAYVKKFVAITRDRSGNEIDGGTITYSLLAEDGISPANVKGVTFDNGKLTVTSSASPAVVYVKATNAEGLSAKIKVDIHALLFAFGSSNVTAGYTQVTNTQYTEKLGYGFASTSGLTVNGNNVTGSSNFRFKAKVPNGNYNIKVVTSAATMTSEVVESVSAVTGISKSGSSYSVAVCDGVLDITFPAGSSVTSLQISQATAKNPLAKPMIYAIGDSTTKNNANGALSWGNVVANGIVKVPSVFSGFANHGMAGRDSVNYYNQGRVEAVLLAICPGDYVTVNMGINSRETNEAASFYTLLSEYYVEGIIQRGGIPVIVTATPDGPVGNKVAENYNSSTGKFTNSRGNGARNDVLRRIANEKNIGLIELGQWGQDWMNTLTMNDVYAYNAANGTSHTTVLAMVQSWYVDHNHYKQYLGVKIAEYLFGRLEKALEDSIVVATGVNLNKASATLKVGETVNLIANVVPQNTTDKTIKWSTDNTNVATVSNDGVVTAVGAGNATITVTTANGKTATCVITVEKVAKIVIVDMDESHWGYNYVYAIIEQKVMNGVTTYEDGSVKFAPDDKLTREMLAQILYNAEGKPNVTGTNKFTDVEPGAWYEKAVIWASENGVVSGYQDGTFGVNRNITRQEIATMLYKFANYKKYDTASSGNLNAYPDAAQVSDWAVNGMNWAIGKNIITGKSGIYLDPMGDATRAEAATMIYRFRNVFDSGK